MYSQKKPGVVKQTVTAVQVFAEAGARLEGPDAMLDSTTADSGSSPTTRIRPGLVIVLDDADDVYYPADHATKGNRNTVASITSTTHSDGNGVIKLVGNHGTISVTTTTGAGTETDNAADLNADVAFANHYIASVVGAQLKIESRDAGSQEWFFIHSDTMATASFAEEIANTVKGTDAEYLVTTDFVDLVDDASVATDAPVATVRVGNFLEPSLRSLTGEARANLVRLGSIFQAAAA